MPYIVKSAWHPAIHLVRTGEADLIDVIVLLLCGQTTQTQYGINTYQLYQLYVLMICRKRDSGESFTWKWRNCHTRSSY